GVPFDVYNSIIPDRELNVRLYDLPPQQSGRKGLDAAPDPSKYIDPFDMESIEPLPTLDYFPEPKIGLINPNPIPNVLPQAFQICTGTREEPDFGLFADIKLVEKMFQLKDQFEGVRDI